MQNYPYLLVQKFPRSPSKRWRLGAWLMATLFLVNTTAFTCNVPVFRYALEKWEPSRYEAVIFHQGDLSPADQSVVDNLTAEAQKSGANLDITLVETAEMDDAQKQLWEQQKQTELPSMALRHGDEPNATLWSGPLKTLIPSRLLESPARQRIAKKLLEGDSAVWVLIESGEKAQDDEAFRVLREQLDEATKTLELPPPAPDDPEMRSSIPLRLQFSIERVSHTDPAEEMFVRMLLTSASDQKEVTWPAVVPIFGRGRALTTFSGATRTKAQITEAAEFITGACSCEVKELNPGSDLLLAANWDDIFSSPAPEPVPLPKPVIATSSPLATTVTTPTEAVAQKPNVLLIAIAAAGVLVIFSGIAVVRSRSRKTSL